MVATKASEIVVGIDFGTTYSGVSWAINGINKVHLINDWPNPSGSNTNLEKVPTIISYKNGKPHNWGYEVNVLNEEKFQWFKLLLDSNKKLTDDVEAVSSSRNLLKSLNKTAEDVAADYLRLLWQYTKDHIERNEGDSWELIYSLRVVLTVPAIWSPIAKEKTIRAARMAGLPENIVLVAEPEAAALAVLKEKHDDNKLEIGDCFVVCDAGGGTVDLISYKITGLEPLKVEECVVGDGDKCGSIFLDKAFIKYVKLIVGEEVYERLKDKAKARMHQDFEGVKRCYTGDNKTYSVDLQGIDDNESVGIDNDTIKLKPSILQTLFDHVVNQIMVLVERQIDTALDGGQQAKAILLVGGFGTNKYIHKRLKNAHQGDGIEVLQVAGGWSAICRGATLWGLEHASESQSQPRTVSARIARYSYGNCWNVPFDASKGHLQIDRRKRPSGWMAMDQMNWLITKGDRLEEGREIHLSNKFDIQISFFETGLYRFSQTLWYCADDEPPSRFNVSHVKELCTVEYGVERSKLYMEPSWKDSDTKEKYRSAFFDLTVALDSAVLHFSVNYKGEQVAYTEANYKEDL